MKDRRARVTVAAGIGLLIVIALFFALVRPQLSKPLPGALLADGRVFISKA